MKHRHRFLIGALVTFALVAALALILTGGQGALAAPGIIYVDTDAIGAKNGNSWKHAYTDLQPALEAAAAGDQIWVAAGTYKPTAEHGGTGDRYRSFQMKNGVAIYGGFDPDTGDVAWEDRDWVLHETILSGDLNSDDGPDFQNNDENSYHVFYHPDGTDLDSSAILDGFTISGGNANGEYGTDHNSGGGIFNESSSPTVANCIFSASSAFSGGGMANWSSSLPAVTNCTFSGNSVGGLGGGMLNDSSSPTVTNCTFSGNSAFRGGGMCNQHSSALVTNCTFSGNSAYEGSGMANLFSDSTPVVANCILWEDSPDEIFSWYSQAVVTYSNVQGGYAGVGNIDADPLFVDRANGDFHLGLDSPCIDAGNNDAPGLPDYDFEGDPRILDGDGNVTAVVDMGVDEASEEPPPPPDVIFVDVDAIGNDTGTSWEDAFNNLQTALEAAASGDQIWVAEGIYTPSQEFSSGDPRSATFQMQNEVSLYGGFDPSVGDVAFEDRNWVLHETILSGDLNGDDGPDFANNDENSYHVFYHPDGTNLNRSAILDGFAVSGGNANLDDSGHHRGGGMFNDGSSPALSNCTFSSNWAYDGGGLHSINGSSPALMDCAFSGNSALWRGGGMFNNRSSPTLTNCTFSGNWAGSDGGGMLNDSVTSPVLTNCTFMGNSTNWNGGGMVNRGASPVLTNCTFSGNSANNGGGMYNFWYSSPMLLDCTFEANSAVAYGGGMYNTSSSSPTLTNSTFLANSAAYDGGGMYSDNSSPALDNCTFTGNSAARFGGGMHNYSSSSPVLTDCTFEGNSAETGGGGISNYDASSPTLVNCAFSGNSASEYGGGMRNGNGSSPMLTNCTFSGNSADQVGGGTFNNNSSSPTLANCTFWDNSADYGGGMANSYSSLPTLTNCTFSGNLAVNSGGGMYNGGSSPVLTNSILWGNSPDQISNDSSTPVVTYSDVQGGYPGETNINEDPLFVDPDNGDFHLSLGSSCIDVGSNDAPDLPAYDFEGNGRVLDGDGNVTAIVDMGVDEVAVEWSYFHVYLPLVLRNY